MPRYSTFQYSQYKYGGGRGLTRSSLFAQVTDYGEVFVNLSAPTRSGYTYMLVRTYNGSAEHPLAGLVVSSGTLTQTEYEIVDGYDNFVDSDPTNNVAIIPGWVYYTLFVFDASLTWTKDAATSVLVPKDRGTLNYVLNALPSVYTAADNNPITPPDPNSDLARFLSGICVTYDELGAYVDTILPENRERNVVRRLHSMFANGIGMPSEYTIGVAASARLRREGGYIYRNKGTTSGIAAYVEALTGWDTTVKESPNLFLSQSESSFEYNGKGNWGSTGCTLTPTVVNGTTVTHAGSLWTYDSVIGPFKKEYVGAIALTATSGTLTLPSDTTDETKMIPVTAGGRYYWSIPLRATSGTPTVTASVLWRDQFGDAISTSTWTAFTTSGTWTQNMFPSTAPSNAAFAVLQLVVAGSIGNTVHVDMMSFSQEKEGYRTNLVTNPNFEVGTTGWSGNGAGTTVARVTTDFTFGTACLQITKAAVTNSGAISTGLPVTANQQYTFSAYAKVPTGQATSGLQAGIDWYNGATYVSTSSGPLVTLTNTSGWARLAVTGTAPSTATQAVVYIVQPTAGTAGQTFLMDAALLEADSSANSYFDGTFRAPANLILNSHFDTDTTGWTGANNTTIARVTTPVWGGTGALSLTKATATGNAQAYTQVYGVAAGNTYSWSFYARAAATARSTSAIIEWYNSAGALLSTTTGTASNDATTAYLRWVVSGTAPANAYSARCYAQFASAAVSEIHYIDGAQFEESATPTTFDATVVSSGTNTLWLGTANASASSTDLDASRILYRDPRSVTVFCKPARTNLILNPDMDANASYWSGNSTSALVRSTAQYKTGLASLLATFNNVSGAGVFASPRIPVIAGQTYTWSMWVRDLNSNVQFRASIEWFSYFAQQGNITISTGTATTVNSTGWTKVTVTAVAPAGATYATPTLYSTSAPTAGTQAYFDTAIFERADASPVFFTGTISDSSGTDSVWTSTAGNSYSSLYPGRLVKLSRLKETLDYYVPAGVTWRVCLFDSTDPEVVGSLPYGLS